MIDRRQWLLGAGACAALLAEGALAAGRGAARPFFAAHRLPLGVQLYALAPDLDADFEGTLGKLRTLGIGIVETAGFHGRSAAQVRAAFDRAGVRCPSAHIPLIAYKESDLQLEGDLDALVRALQTVGVTHVVVPSPRMTRQQMTSDPYKALTTQTREDWQRLAATLNTVGKTLRGHGMTISYHNHNVEFAPHDWGTAFDLLMRETDPKIVSFELDAGWAAAAGISTVELLRAHPHRFTQMHVKDIKTGAAPNFALKQEPADVGSGGMDWAAILPAAYAAGVRNFFIEQEPPFVGPRIDSIRRSATYLLGLKTA